MNKILDTIASTGFFARHCRAAGGPFHEDMPYPDDAERIPLVSTGVHAAVDACFRDEYGDKVQMFRKRLAINPIRLEVYNDRESLVGSYTPEEWTKQIRFHVEQELNINVKRDFDSETAYIVGKD